MTGAQKKLGEAEEGEDGLAWPVAFLLVVPVWHGDGFVTREKPGGKVGFVMRAELGACPLLGDRMYVG